MKFCLIKKKENNMICSDQIIILVVEIILTQEIMVLVLPIVEVIWVVFLTSLICFLVEVEKLHHILADFQDLMVLQIQMHILEILTQDLEDNLKDKNMKLA